MTLKEFTKSYNVFNNIKTRHPDHVTWLGDATTLNKLLGAKYAHRIIDENIVELPTPDIDFISDCLLLEFENEWDRFYNLTIVDYDPLANVDARETTTETRNLNVRDVTSDSKTNTRATDSTETKNLTHTDDATDTKAVTRSTDTTENTEQNTSNSQTDNKSTSQTTENNINAYNNVQAKPSSNQEVSQTDNNTSSITGSNDVDTTTNVNETISDKLDHDNTSKDTGTNVFDIDETATENFSHENTHTDTGTVTTEVRRIGNIGVTKTTELIQADIDLWSKNRLYDKLLFDVADFLTERVY